MRKCFFIFYKLKKIRIIFLFLLLTFITVYSYHGLFYTYFRQDEWYTMGEVFSSGPFAFLYEISLLEILTGKIRPIGTFIHKIFISLFPFQVFPFVVFGLIFHAINALLIFILSHKLTKNIFVGFIASLIFVSSSTIHQGLTWFAATVTTLGSTFFFLLAIYLFLMYIDNPKIIFFFISCVFLYISTLFKEIAMIGFLIIPTMFFILKKKDLRYNSAFLILIPSVIYIFLLLLGRVVPLLGKQVSSAYVHFSGNEMNSLIFHMLLYPFSSFSQQFIPRNIAIKLSFLYQELKYPYISNLNNFSFLIDYIILDIISLFFTFILFFITFVFFVNLKKNRKILFFLILSSMMSFIPYIILKRGQSYLDSRYYYFGFSFGAIFLSLIFFNTITLIKKHISFLFLKYFIILLCFFTLAFYIYKNIIFIHREIMSIQFYSSIQLKFLREIKNLYPYFHDNTVIYLTGDRTFYGVDNLYVPLQAGPGHILLVWYSQESEVARQLLKDLFFYDIKNYGYKKLDEIRGFGYYNNLNNLLVDYQNDLFKEDNVYAFFYNSSSYELKDITNEIRTVLRDSMKNKIK